MATAPWRCSQCGTINEPVANSCRTCGKWPSLFDLEDNLVDDASAVDVMEEYDEHELLREEYQPDVPEAVTVEIEAFEPPVPQSEPAGELQPTRRRGFDAPPTDPVLGEGEDTRPRWISWIIPLAVVVYFVISFFVNNR